MVGFNDHISFFQTGNAPVFLRGKSDRLMYRSAMGICTVGVALTFGALYLMATKERKIVEYEIKRSITHQLSPTRIVGIRFMF